MRFNGVEVPDFDHPLWDHPHKDDYEYGLIESIRSVVEEGDFVVNIGAGIGVSSVAAYRQGGDVLCYEASSDFVDICRRTVDLNGAEVEVRHGCVSEPFKVLGTEDGDVIYPEELPDCDVLVMDCEGSERGILSNLEITPESIIVETHGCFGSSRGLIKSLLENRGYSVVDSKIAEIGDLKGMCLNKDVYVLTAKLNES